MGFWPLWEQQESLCGSYESAITGQRQATFQPFTKSVMVQELARAFIFLFYRERFG